MSFGMALLFLMLRFMVIILPMVAVLRVLASIREAQEHRAMEQPPRPDLHPDITALLWVSVAHLDANPKP
jgi:hypothetical protein